MVSFGRNARTSSSPPTSGAPSRPAASPRSPAATLRLNRDDGAVVYLNGTEVFRTNMPGGAISYTTLGLQRVAAENDVRPDRTIDPIALVEGANVLAVEIHQTNVDELGHQLRSRARWRPTASAITRGRTCSSGRPSSIVVRWRTNVADSTARASTARRSHDLDSTVNDPALTTEHVVQFDGPRSRHPLLLRGRHHRRDPGRRQLRRFTFVTAPPPGTRQPIRVWVLGDSGTADVQRSRGARRLRRAAAAPRPTDLWLMLGDNAYQSGTDTEYQAAVFDMYPQLPATSSVLWPTLGNHDGDQLPARRRRPVPTTTSSRCPRPAAGRRRGVGHRGLLLVRLGQRPLRLLDSYESDRTPPSPMITWLEDDLAATDADWIVAFWHHPPYTKGGHNSDTDDRVIADAPEHAARSSRPTASTSCSPGTATPTSAASSSTATTGLRGPWTAATHALDGGDGRPPRAATARTPSRPAGPRRTTARSTWWRELGEAHRGGSRPSSDVHLDRPAVLGSLVLEIDGDRLDVTFVDLGRRDRRLVHDPEERGRHADADRHADEDGHQRRRPHRRGHRRRPTPQRRPGRRRQPRRRRRPTLRPQPTPRRLHRSPTRTPTATPTATRDATPAPRRHWRRAPLQQLQLQLRTATATATLTATAHLQPHHDSTIALYLYDTSTTSTLTLRAPARVGGVDACRQRRACRDHARTTASTPTPLGLRGRHHVPRDRVSWPVTAVCLDAVDLALATERVEGSARTTGQCSSVLMPTPRVLLRLLEPLDLPRVPSHRGGGGARRRRADLEADPGRRRLQRGQPRASTRTAATRSRPRPPTSRRTSRAGPASTACASARRRCFRSTA